MAAVGLAETVGKAAACAALEVSRATFHRRQSGRGTHAAKPRPTPARALAEVEKQQALEILHDERFADFAPAEIHATLLDEGRYICSTRTYYRLLERKGEVRERRDQLRHPLYVKPELLATGPNQVWSWDITKLLGPRKWEYFNLYLAMDIFSRYAVGWMVSSKENARLAVRLFEEAHRRHQLVPGQVTVHQDRGAPMTSKTLGEKMIDLGVAQSFSRPRVSNDNPFSEAAFKTLKYRPAFPDRFGSIEDARAHCRTFFGWYNDAHRHSGIGFLTPAMVHFGRANEVRDRRAQVLSVAYAAHPERFVNRIPVPAELPSEVWINPPSALELQ